MMTRTDNHRLLDRCARCGGLAKFTEHEDRRVARFGVRCLGCNYAVDHHADESRAMVVWNQTQRGVVKERLDKREPPVVASVRLEEA